MSGKNRNRKKNGWLIALFAVLVVVDVILVALILSGRKPGVKAPQPTATTAATEAVTQPSTEAPTEPPTTQMPATESTQPAQTPPAEETEEEVTPAQPERLTALLENGGITYDRLEEIGCKQLVSVVSVGTEAQIRFFTCTDGVWEERPELFCQGYVGWNGVSGQKQENDGCTPSGFYGIGSAFYIYDQPETGLDVFQITNETYWVDDPESVYYNQRVEGTRNQDWNSAEYMIGYDTYRYGFVVEYNLQAEKYAGSAIFFHIGDNATAGCIATEESMVLHYLKELDREQMPHILILSGNGP